MRLDHASRVGERIALRSRELFRCHTLTLLHYYTLRALGFYHGYLRDYLHRDLTGSRTIDQI